MKIIIKGKSKEMADFVLELQNRPQHVEIHGCLNQGEIVGDSNCFYDADKALEGTSTGTPLMSRRFFKESRARKKKMQEQRMKESEIVRDEDGAPKIIQEGGL